MATNTNSKFVSLDHPMFGLDGTWSTQTHELAERFHVVHVDLNKGWAKTSQDWVCPVCHRSKRDIARVVNDYLLLHLVSHHDHICDYIGKWRERNNIPSPLCESDRRVDDFLKLRVLPFVCRFYPTVMCEDCNNADGAVKGRMKLPADFSFAPAEISSFIQAGVNRPHDIATGDAKLAFDRAKSWHSFALEFIDKMVSDSHIELHSFDWRPSLERANAHATRILLDKFGSEISLETFCSESVSRRKIAKFAKSKPVKKPSRGDFFVYKNPHPDRHRDWLAIGESWNCPICRRSKFEVFRYPSNGSGVPNGEVVPKVENSIFPESESSQTIYICKDCNDLSRRIGIELARLGDNQLREQLFEVGLAANFVRRFISPRPHATHTYRIDEAISELRRTIQDGDFEVDF